MGNCCTNEPTCVAGPRPSKVGPSYLSARALPSAPRHSRWMAMTATRALSRSIRRLHRNMSTVACSCTHTRGEGSTHQGG